MMNSIDYNRKLAVDNRFNYVR